MAPSPRMSASRTPFSELAVVSSFLLLSDRRKGRHQIASTITALSAAHQRSFRVANVWTRRSAGWDALAAGP